MKLTIQFLDILLSAIGIVLTFPLQVFIYSILLFQLKENPLFIQERGITFQKGRLRILKFRTIRSSEIKNSYNENCTAMFLINAEKYFISKFCLWLRNTGLDELPQLYNVLTGQMSLVGPRPLMLTDLQILKDKFTEHYHLREKLCAKPGITGVWQLFGERSLGAKNLTQLDYFLEKNLSTKLYLRLLFNTFIIIVFRKNTQSVLHKLNLFDRIFSSSFFDVDNDSEFGEIVVEDSKKELHTYKINIPANWWYVCDSYHSQKASPKFQIIEINKVHKKSS